MPTDAGERAPTPPTPAAPRPFAAIALGFFALALPLFVAVALSENATGAWTNAAAGAVFVALGALLWTRRG
ncbi:MAG TPA: hypothetical protein VFI25_19335 [Planctomycetota bacterium]|nr:hypothetical protein [Planctomycetota bacterium]